MKILVAYKRVVDYNVRIQVKPDGSGVVTDGVKLSPNPFDEIALEEALRLRDAGIATEVVVATLAPADAAAHLRNGLAMGANRAIHVVTDAAIQPLTAARTLLKLVEKEQPDLVILGKQAIDDDANQTGQMLATLWGRPQATFAGKLVVAGGKATVTREVDAGLETLEVDLPAVITTDLRLNEPRFIKLPDIMKAKSKPLETLAFADLGVAAHDSLSTTHYAAPSKRSRGVMVKDAAELVAALKQKGLL
ncbi:electron transfer flavoprotein subunit beta/FixA family protein [Xanthomonas fragariae]|uniref:electron transfer flavoprotein subunit beta/FixA family protein n=1 Tax=Xanthomonas fragariae TaxID=48664 RepID=UPI001ABE6F49|nr:electron transfer flavoprotein subunit beta/FixA family protein [Xanthomonas fragariae]UKR53041.1 electron transfer flavoprotein subunit beta/FixA family protein [Xanthomonas fragariae]WAT15446.1 electron transfer flavoprotein subunit beta/FixA family protein [Xanthomonas fragariae]